MSPDQAEPEWFAKDRSCAKNLIEEMAAVERGMRVHLVFTNSTQEAVH